MKRIFLLLGIAILLQSCLKYPAGSGGYDGSKTNGGSSGGNQTPNGNDRPQTNPQSTPQEPSNYPQTPQSRSGKI
jgi:PBP1b-binding outer membrane lipoprotein LpoB